MKKIFLVALVAIFFVLEGCKNDSYLGFDLIKSTNDTTYVQYYEQFATTPVTHDTLMSVNYEYGLVGQANDPVFGTTKAGFTMQFELGGTTPTFAETIDGETVNVAYGTNFKVDSMVLYIGYNLTKQNTLGNPLAPQKLTFTQLASYPSDSSYLHTDVNQFLSDQILAQAEHVYQAQNTTYFKVKLSNAALFEAFDNNIVKATQSTTEFQDELFKGIAVTNTDDNNTMINLFWLYSDSTRLRMYYKNDQTVAADSVVYHDFPCYKYLNGNTKISTSNYYTFTSHDYSAAEFSEIVDRPELKSNKAIYIQSLGGVRTQLNFPELKTWLQTQKSKNSYVRKAHLILRPNKTKTDENYPDLTNLILLELDEKGKQIYLPEYISVSNGGVTAYNSESYDSVDDEFRFDVTSYLQKLWLDDTQADNGLILRASSPITKLGRSVLYGASDDTPDGYSMQLKVTFSEIE